MRIIAGKYKHKSLFYPKDRTLRATQTKVRKAVFDILSSDIEGAVFLDCCCGTGSMSLEALSRGAKQSIAVDLDVKFVKKNGDGVENMAIIRQDILSFLKQYRQYPRADIVFLDPPWNESQLYESALPMIFVSDILSDQGVVICEHYKKYHLPPIPASRKQYVYGDTIITFMYPTQE